MSGKCVDALDYGRNEAKNLEDETRCIGTWRCYALGTGQASVWQCPPYSRHVPVQDPRTHHASKFAGAVGPKSRKFMALSGWLNPEGPFGLPICN